MLHVLDITLHYTRSGTSEDGMPGDATIEDGTSDEGMPGHGTHGETTSKETSKNGKSRDGTIS